MKKIILLTIVIIVALAPLANAFNIKFENTTDRTLIYMLDWLAPDWKGAPEKSNMAGGELEAGESQLLITDYGPGPYTVTWENLSSSNNKFYKSYTFKVEKAECLVILTPETAPVIEPLN